MAKVYIFISAFLLTCVLSNLHAEVDLYQETENTGLNKKERIDNIEKFLTQFSSSLKTLEAKFEENSKKLKQLQDIIDALKANSKLTPKVAGEVQEKSANIEYTQLKKEIDALKSKEIEKLKADIFEITDSIKMIQLKLKNK